VAAAVAAGVVLAPALLTLRSLPRQPHVAVSDVTSSALAGNDGQMLATSDPTQLASAGDTSSDVVDPEDAALAAFDEAL
jgi:hypothetical protein